MSWIKRFIAVCAAMTLSLGTSALAAPAAEWTLCMEADSAACYEGIVDYYRAEHPGVAVKIEAIPGEGKPGERAEAVRRLREQIARGEGPDVFLLSGDLTGGQLFADEEEIEKSGYFCAIAELLEQHKIVLPGDIPPALRRFRKALPLGYTVAGVVTTPEALEKYGIDPERLQKNRGSFIRELERLPETLYGDCLDPLREALLTDYAVGLSKGMHRVSVSDSVNLADRIAADTQRNEQGSGALPMAGGLMHPGSDLWKLAQARPSAVFVPLPDEKEGVAVRVSAWAGVRAASAHQKEAADFIGCLLEEAFQHGLTGAAQTADAAFRGQSFGEGLPVRADCLAHLSAQMGEGAEKSLLAAAGRIHAARFRTDEDEAALRVLGERTKPLADRLTLLQIEMMNRGLDAAEKA